MKRTFLQFIVHDVATFYIRSFGKKGYEKHMSKIISKTKIFNKTLNMVDLSYTRVGSLNIDAYVSSEPLSFENKTEGKLIKNLKAGDVWAEEIFDCAWFHVTGTIPAGLCDENVKFMLDLGGEGLVYSKNGEMKQAITCSASQYDYTLGLPIKKVVEGFSEDGVVDFWIDGAANDLFGNLKRKARIAECSVAYCNENVRALAYDLQVLMSVFETNKTDDYTKQCYGAVKKALKGYKSLTDEDAKKRREEIKPLLEQANKGEQFEYFAVGHAHLDLAWLWPIRETKRKGARTISSQLHNIEKYPGYIFGASQGQLYEWIKEEYPELYSKVQKAAETPFWDVQGATWVEMDSNLIGGESMIRQFFYGKKFFREEFGQDMKILWLPDSFGYSACLPQVMKLADVPYFLTQKMSWNTVNKFPYHTFYWQGLDGSEVFAHMLPDDTYNGPLNGARLKFGEQNYQERKISSKAISLFGIGDGGAGPGYEHIERMQRFSDLDHMPKVTPKKALESFEILDDKNTPYPTHSGELYLERHRGTYTTQSKNKKYNRKSEFLLRNYEILMAEAIENGIELPISKEDLEKIWKEVLLYQFHDILPGSSINRVYVESVARYEIILDELTDGIKVLLAKLYPGGVFNFNSFAYEKYVKFEDGWYYGTIKPLGFTPKSSLVKTDSFTSISTSDNSIENEYIKAVFKKGTIVSLVDKATGKEFVKPGKAMGVFQKFTDYGDCWDIHPITYYKKSGKTAVSTGFETSKDGAEAVCECNFKLGDSSISVRYSLADKSKVLKADISIDCKQKNSMMRVDFPTSIESDECKFNIQFGHIGRKTTENNSVEKAQFEVSGQKFVDISDGKNGFSLINDCKYGFRAKHGSINVDLIRSPLGGPGKNVDQGRHEIRLGLFLHDGKLGTETYENAYDLNNPLSIIEDGVGTSEKQLFTSNNNSIILESVKICEDNSGLVLRLYNSAEHVQNVTVGYEGYTSESLVGIMENELCKSEGSLEFKPFELKLLKVVRK